MQFTELTTKATASLLGWKDTQKASTALSTTALITSQASAVGLSLWIRFCVVRYYHNQLKLRYNLIAEKKENRKKMRYLLGESLGGALAILLHRKKPDFWDGAVLSAPMCKVSINFWEIIIVICGVTKYMFFIFIFIYLQ